MEHKNNPYQFWGQKVKDEGYLTLISVNDFQAVACFSFLIEPERRLSWFLVSIAHSISCLNVFYIRDVKRQRQVIN
jgi:hypothetical protein